MIAQSVRGLPAQSAASGLRRRLRTASVFALAAGVLLVVWAGLATLYMRTAAAPQSVSPRAVVMAATSTVGRSGAADTTGIFVTSEYFKALGVAPAAMGVDPARGQVILVNLDTHETNLPEPADWWSGALLQLPGQRGAGPAWYRTLLRSEHHQSVALQFTVRSGLTGVAALTLPPLVENGAAPEMRWSLPFQFPKPSPASSRGGSPVGSLAALLAVMGGLLTVFSPCAFHMIGTFLPTVTGLGMRHAVERSADRRFRLHVALLGLAFVSGFVVLYTIFGALAGLAGQLVSDTTRLRPLLGPVRIVAGGAVVLLALQALGLFRLPFVIDLQLPGNLQRYLAKHGYIAAALAGINVSTGCMTCVGGTFLASLLLYAGAAGSAMTGALTLFLFSVGVSIPFLLIALAFNSVLPLLSRHWGLLRHSSTVAAAAMLVVGLLILSNQDSIFERIVLGATGG